LTLSNSLPSLSGQRLLDRIEKLGQIGATLEGGVRRLALSDEDKVGRDLVIEWMRDAGLVIQVDTIGNIFGTRPGKTDLPPVMTGSHIDTVGNGGKLDGNLGVLTGLEIVETLNEHDIETDRPITIGIFTNEEGARFQPDMMGSLVHAGGLGVEDALDIRDDQGVRLGDELTRIGYAGDMPSGTIVPHAFVELHIEQGPILELEGVTLGAVQNLQGISWTEVIFTGQSNHAGTTPMHLRHDTSYCAGALTVFARALANELGQGQVATIGVIELQPNIINVVPGRSKVTVDLRNADNDVLLEAERRLGAFLEKLASDEGVEISTKRLVRFDPVRFDAGIVEVIERQCQAKGYSYRRMTSGAGHDAQMMARVCPTAMIFTPSINGISHNPAEATAPEDLLAGAEVLFGTMLDLANGDTP
jgi:beta-ureidopropionase / N-carbamoyl-L-amino-acid hydrolase